MAAVALSGATAASDSRLISYTTLDAFYNEEPKKKKKMWNCCSRILPDLAVSLVVLCVCYEQRGNPTGYSKSHSAMPLFIYPLLGGWRVCCAFVYPSPW